jgi:hypothetical protein
VGGAVAPTLTLDPAELRMLEASEQDKSRWLRVTVNGCAYSGCGRGWRYRDGYEQTYVGWVDKLKLPDGPHVGGCMLDSEGLATISYVIAARFDEVELVEEYTCRRMTRATMRRTHAAACSRSRTRRRAGASSRTSSADRGDPSEPEPSRPRRCAVCGEDISELRADARACRREPAVRQRWPRARSSSQGGWG